LTREKYTRDLLSFREALSQRRTALNTAGAIVQLQFNIPGIPKCLPGLSTLFGTLCAEVAGAFKRQGVVWGLGYLHYYPQHTAIFSTDGPPEALKRCMVKTECSHALGSIVDIDVYEPSGKALGRRHLGMPERTCLLCDRPAKSCAAMQAHGYPELREAICCMIEGFETGSEHALVSKQVWHQAGAGGLRETCVAMEPKDASGRQLD